MHPRAVSTLVRACTLVLVFGICGAEYAVGQLQLGPEQIVKANGVDLTVLGYSVPALADWNNDGRQDLIVGEGGNGYTGKLRVYLNTGSATNPAFGTPFYAQSGSADLAVTPAGCLGMFPRMVDWDNDGRKDLLAGQGDGSVKLFRNTGAVGSPIFDSGLYLQVGPAGGKANINVSGRATCSSVDWNNDGRKDLVVGDINGMVRVFLNTGTDAAPDFTASSYIQSGGTNLFVSAYRASPAVLDLDGDGKKDLLIGDTNGELLFYRNLNTDSSPVFSASTPALSNGLPVNLGVGSRSRPFVGDWNGDGRLDVLVGAGDGKVHVFAVTPEPGMLGLVGAALGLMLRRRK